MLTFAREVGGDIYDIWSGLKEENLGRTYIMAKNIVEANKVRNEYAYYDIGTNIITYTYGRQGKEYMLMDFQKIELEEPLKDKDDNWTNKDTDGDGILDRNELGEDSDSDDESRMWKDVDITMFIRKAVEKELYGNDTDTINSVEGKKTVDIALSQVKYNIYNDRKTFNEEHKDDNMCSRREYKENYLNIDSKTEVKIENKTETESINIIKNTDSKLTVRLWKYKSNPVLKDTDFDGIDDSKDKSPKNNHFEGRLNSSQISGADAIEVDMNMDYRYFFLSNKLYYDELSTMSLLYANSVYMKGSPLHSGVVIENNMNIAEGNEESLNIKGTKYKNLKVKEMMEFFGFKDTKTYYLGSPGDLGDENKKYFDNKIKEKEKNNSGKKFTIEDILAEEKEDITYKGIGTKYENLDDIYLGYKDTHKSRVAIGYKNIEYHGLEKTVIGVVIRGTSEDDGWTGNFDIGDIRIKELIEQKGKKDYFGYDDDLQKLGYDKKYRKELNHFIDGYDDWTNDYHHASFDIVSNRILEVLKEYINTNNSNFNKEICFWVTGHSRGAGVANLVGASLVDGICGGNRDNVYCYTFAAPNTFYTPDNKYSRDNTALPGKKIEGEYREPRGIRYRCIFNTINEDDFVPKLPMKDCGWTRYGRDASVSVKNEYYKNYDSLNISISVDTNKNPIIKNYALYKFLTAYNGNPQVPKSIEDGFNEIFEDKKNMREEAYLKAESITFLEHKGVSPNNTLYIYTLPYQKNEKKGEKIVKKGDNTYEMEEYEQEQRPAFLFQVIASAMHEYSVNRETGERVKNAFGNKTYLMGVPLPKKYSKARMKVILNTDPLRLNAIFIIHPHYLESYYSLTKMIETTDFK